MTFDFNELIIRSVGVALVVFIWLLVIFTGFGVWTFYSPPCYSDYEEELTYDEIKLQEL